MLFDPNNNNTNSNRAFIHKRYQLQLPTSPFLQVILHNNLQISFLIMTKANIYIRLSKKAMISFLSIITFPYF